MVLLMTEPTIEQLRDAWRAAPPKPAHADALAELLRQRFRAYEVPLGLFPASEYEMDDEVISEDLWKLFLITDVEVLSGLIAPQAIDRTDWPPPAEEGRPPALDPDWPEVFGNFQGELLPVQEVGYRLYAALSSRGLALAFALESRDGVTADGFKVFGGSIKLTDILIGHIGWDKYRRSAEDPYGVAIGDIDDEDFARYLRMAYAEGLLRLEG